METIVLTNEIQKYLEKGNVECNDVLRYYLNKNIKTIFGKDDFTSQDVEINYIVSKEMNYQKLPHIEEKKVVLFLNVLGSIYRVYLNEAEKTLEMKKQGLEVGFKIFKTRNGLANTLTNIQNAETIVEYQNVSLEKQIFDYQKVVYTVDGEEKVFDAYRMSPMGTKIKEKEVFCLEPLLTSRIGTKHGEFNNGPLLKRFLSNCEEILENLKVKSEIVSVSTSYQLNDPKYYLEEIFQILEEKSKEDVLSKDRKIS